MLKRKKEKQDQQKRTVFLYERKGCVVSWRHAKQTLLKKEEIPEVPEMVFE